MKMILIVATAILALTATAHAGGYSNRSGVKIDLPYGRSPL